MYWPKFSFRKLMRLVRKDRRRFKDSGVSCYYVKWTKYVGLKLYTVKKERDRCAKIQRQVAESGLAPKVGAMVEFEMLTCSGIYPGSKWNDDNSPDLEWITIYGFWTEHVKVPRKMPPRKKVEALWESLRDVGIVHDDLHRRNIGRIGRKLVCIDFDTASCRKAKRSSYHYFTYHGDTDDTCNTCT